MKAAGTRENSTALLYIQIQSRKSSKEIGMLENAKVSGNKSHLKTSERVINRTYPIVYQKFNYSVHSTFWDRLFLKLDES